MVRWMPLPKDFTGQLLGLSLHLLPEIFSINFLNRQLARNAESNDIQVVVQQDNKRGITSSSQIVPSLLKARTKWSCIFWIKPLLEQFCWSSHIKTSVCDNKLKKMSIIVINQCTLVLFLAPENRQKGGKKNLLVLKQSHQYNIFSLGKCSCDLDSFI